ncbi:MAG: Putative dioxygenase [uncultured Truepera sp.]|uniref:Dioxygenase n=1 Tax=uncultured Truepera sp. TaxID=543023 RepID=A0A6J4UTM6_9DEIN|nr:MAG: Putative dioxygenase [uncultured Truepera sp.]
MSGSSVPTSASSPVKAGVPLALTLRVFQIGESCTPLAGATVDVWHCDAQGDYSDVTDRTEGFDTVGQTWLRGYQVTDENGEVTFKTIYPGWYRGRAVHIHFKVRTSTSAGANYEFTSQLYFDDALSDRVFKQEPYVTGEAREILNANDMIFSDGGDQLLLALTESGAGLRRHVRPWARPHGRGHGRVRRRPGLPWWSGQQLAAT